MLVSKPMKILSWTKARNWNEIQRQLKKKIHNVLLFAQSIIGVFGGGTTLSEESKKKKRIETWHFFNNIIVRHSKIHTHTVSSSLFSHQIFLRRS